jgi:hypothetical protein
MTTDAENKNKSIKNALKLRKLNERKKSVVVNKQ